jgi:hypothetical protein
MHHQNQHTYTPLADVCSESIYFEFWLYLVLLVRILFTAKPADLDPPKFSLAGRPQIA